MTLYDDNNVFAKIIRGELKCNEVYQDDNILSFEDIYKQAPIHVLVIPKGKFLNLADFIKQTDEKTVGNFFMKVDEIAKKVSKDSGYRILSNIAGSFVKQDVMHFHVHILSGAEFGAKIVNIDE